MENQNKISHRCKKEKKRKQQKILPTNLWKMEVALLEATQQTW